MKQGWTYKKLGELGTIVTGSTPSTKIKEYYCSNDYCFIKPSDLPAEGYQIIVESENYISSKGYEVSRKLPKGSVLVSCIGIIGKTAILGMDACTNQQINAIIPNEYVNNKFLAYSILSQRYVLSSVANAPVVPLINKSDFSKVEIPLPPLSVQHSIVSELDKINELIRLKMEQLKDYDNLAQSIFYEMFGDPVVNEKGWEVKKLGEVCTYPNKRISLSDITSYEYVGVETLVKNKGGVIFTEELPNAKNAIEYIENDILIGNIRPYLKKIWKSDRHGGASGDVVIIRISDSMKGLLTPVYLFKLLSTDEFFEYDNANTHGAKMPRGDRKAIGEFTIQIPPMHIQHIFAQRIELIEKQKAEVQRTISDLETLLASRMQYWFD